MRYKEVVHTSKGDATMILSNTLQNLANAIDEDFSQDGIWMPLGLKALTRMNDVCEDNEGIVDFGDWIEEQIENDWITL